MASGEDNACTLGIGDNRSIGSINRVRISSLHQYAMLVLFIPAQAGIFFWFSPRKEQRMEYFQRISVSFLLLVSPVALASSPEAWQKSQQVMRQACINASTLSKVKVLGQVVEYDDSVGYSALLLEGLYPQKHMKNRRGRELCLFQRSSGRASVSEANQYRLAK
ncbi:hypothetical protein NB724_003084 [Pantoea ananatis]|uniref:Uncharacterized protein n=2 Tax=Erwiniaceae TaxID=1903409 RepID=A0AAJ1FSF9_PANAN|nr:hypothetical protein [Pantoea ananatis]MCW0336061.1 hypothetical protein [Pantoea ananatis]MCW0342405.1 hypothetical protein [Pantoea ananatis]MCW0350251.1 hypothetical protein [Pantoea ananatis]MCW0384026.1 hypothetical protein [Pantoea ananatis]